MNNTNWLHLPESWGALWPIISNPAIAGIVISIAMEQWGWIQNTAVPNIRKLGVVFLACLVWGTFIIVAAPDFNLTGETLKPVIFSIIMMAVGITATSQLGYLLIQGIPWLKDILTVLFGTDKSTIKVTAETSGGTLASGDTSTLFANVKLPPFPPATGESSLGYSPPVESSELPHPDAKA